MNTPLKALIGFSAVGGAVGGSYLIHQQLSTESITDKLKSDGYQILSNDSGDWTEILKHYKLVAQSNDTLKFDNVTIESKENLQEQCKKALKADPSNTYAYRRSAKWCTVPRTLKEILASNGDTPLSTDNNKDNIDQSEWNAKIIAHNKESENQDKKFTIDGATGNKLSTQKKEDRDKMRDSCRALENKKHYEQTFESDLEKSILWCVE